VQIVGYETAPDGGYGTGAGTATADSGDEHERKSGDSDRTAGEDGQNREDGVFGNHGADGDQSRDTAEGTAGLLVATDGEITRIALRPGRSLSYRLDDRHCAGSIGEDGHETCDQPAAPFCPDHTDRWPCALCTGECNLPLSSCREEHAVYLAGFRPATFKVGVTKAWRLETRLREQGAAGAALLRTVADGRIARQIEADIAGSVGDSVRVEAKIRGLHEGFDEDAWSSLLGGYDHLGTVSFDYGLTLEDRPMQETLATGTVRGTKGRVLVLDRGGSTYAVDLRDLVGFEVEVAETDRTLQSSLGAWE
jgi:hypothetical protein